MDLSSLFLNEPEKRTLLMVSEDTRLSPPETGIPGFKNCTLVEEHDPDRIWKAVDRLRPQVVLIDIERQGPHAAPLMAQLKSRHPDLLILVLTPPAAIDQALRCLAQGAYDYRIKPLPPQALGAALQRAYEKLELEKENAGIRTALQQSREQFIKLADSLPIMVAYVDLDQRYRYSNPAYADWFGKDKSNLYGQPVKDVLGESAFRVTQPYIRSALTGQEVTRRGFLPHGDGGLRFMEAKYKPVFDSGGQVQGFLGLIQDLTESQTSGPPASPPGSEAPSPFLDRARNLGLSLRESQITELICQGLPDRDISRKLDIKVNTLRHHLKSVYRKLGVHSRVQLVLTLNHPHPL